MFKKISILILALTLVLAGCAGAPEITAKETLTKVMDKQVELNDVAVKFNLAANVELDEAVLESDPSAAEIISMFKDFKATFGYKVVDMKSDFKASFDGSVDLDGVTVAFDGYLDKEMAAVNYPMLGKYVTVNFKEVIDMAKSMAAEEAAAEVSDDLVERIIKDINEVFMPKVVKYTNETLTDEDVKFVDDFAFVVDGEEVKEKALVYTLTPERMTDYSLGLYKYLAYDEEVYNTLKAYDIPDFPADFETFKAEFDKIFGEFEDEEMKAEMKKAFEGVTYEIAMAYNDDYTVKYSKIRVDAEIDTEDETIGVIKYNYAVDSAYEYKDIVVEKPELNDENSMDFMMFIQSMMM